MTTFEARLTERLNLEFGGASPAFDAAEVAGRAVGARGRRDRWLARFGLADALPLPAAQRRAILVLGAAALILVTLALAVGFAQLGGERLALVRTNGDLVLANADGSGQRVVGHLERSPLRTVVSWAPDGGHLAFLGEDWQLTIVDRAGEISFRTKLEDRWSQFAWSPDGRRLAIFDGSLLPDEGGEGPPAIRPNLSIVTADGVLDSSVTLPADFRYVLGNGEVAWSPDGSLLAITGYLDGLEPGSFPSSIFVVDSAALTVRQIESGPATTNDFRARWLPDGRILFSRQNSGLWVVDPATNAESMVYEMERSAGGAQLIETLEPSPDGTRVAMVAPNVGLAILDLATGAIQALDFPDGGADFPLGWTADGRAVTMRWGPQTDQPFLATSVASLDVVTGKLTILASDVIMYDLRP